ncbi:MAG: hypothetical protein Aurels2KO_24960 [Aureliella sp.]
MRSGTDKQNSSEKTSMRKFNRDDRVVYTRDKYTSCPGPRAKNVVATPNGESYQYQVDKYWIVSDIRPDGRLVLSTRTGKTHIAAADDPRLRKATWLERLLKASRFPAPVDSQLKHQSESNYASM